MHKHYVHKSDANTHIHAHIHIHRHARSHIYTLAHMHTYTYRYTLHIALIHAYWCLPRCNDTDCVYLKMHLKVLLSIKCLQLDEQL